MSIQAAFVSVAGLLVLTVGSMAVAQDGQGFVGAGIALRQGEQGQVIIERVLDGGPAAQAGIQAGDLLLAVGDRDVRQLPFEQIPSMVRGPAGSQVAMWVQSGGQPPRQVTITRAAIAGPIPPTGGGQAPPQQPQPMPPQPEANPWGQQPQPAQPQPEANPWGQQPQPAQPQPQVNPWGQQPQPAQPQPQVNPWGQHPQQATDAQPRPTPQPQMQPPAAPQQQAAPGGGNVLRFQRMTIRDPQVGNEEAVILLVPVGWQMQGQMVWMHEHSVLANPQIVVSDPQSGTQVTWLPYQHFVFMPNAPFPVPQWGNYMGKLWCPPITDPGQFVQTFWMPSVLQHLQNARLVGQQELPGLAANALRQYGGQALSKAYRMRFEFAHNGQPWEEDIIFGLLFPGGGPEVQMWYVHNAYSIRAPKGMIDRTRTQTSAILGSAHTTPVWQATYQVCQQLQTQRKLQQIRNTADFGRQLAEHREHTQKLSQQIAQERDQSAARRSEAFREALGGIETYKDPYKGQGIELPAGYQEYWVNPKGEYILSDAVGYDPNHGSTQEWHKMERRNPMNPGPGW